MLLEEYKEDEYIDDDYPEMDWSPALSMEEELGDEYEIDEIDDPIVEVTSPTQHRLSLNQERLLLRRIAAGDSSAENILVEAHMGLLHYFASRYTGMGVPREDLVQEGVIGLLEAMRRFDLSKGVRFSTYAGWWVKQKQIRALQEQGAGIPLTAYQQSQKDIVDRVQETLQQQYGYAPSREELEEALLDDEEGFQSSLTKVESYPTATHLQEENSTAAEDDVLEDLINDLDSAALTEALELMPEQNQSIVRWRYGIGGPRYSLSDCGKKMGVSTQRAHQIEKRAMRYLRYAPEAGPIRDFLHASNQSIA